jgi:cyclic pyranopterin phosphate synthase
VLNTLNAPPPAAAVDPAAAASVRASSALASGLADARGRVKRKLRLSLTDRCNLRCVYCMPDTPKWLPKAQILRQDEILRLVRLFVEELGITDIRLTGGEPLLRADVVEIVAALDALRPLGLERIAMTSNGGRLPQLAAELRAAGLDDINISLDARTPATFTRLTGGGAVEPVLDGIAAARAAGLPVKINSVVIRDHNEQEVLPLLRWAMEADMTLRFIEFMPLDGRGYWNADRVFTQDEIVATLSRHHHIEALPETDDPARYFDVDGRHRFGIISTISKPFCRRCDRVRLSSTGTLYSCLFSAAGADLRAPLRDGADDHALVRQIRGHVWHKEAGYAEQPGYVERPITMHMLGG